VNGEPIEAVERLRNHWWWPIYRHTTTAGYHAPTETTLEKA
jgi:hypothetical protein